MKHTIAFSLTLLLPCPIILSMQIEKTPEPKAVVPAALLTSVACIKQIKENEEKMSECAKNQQGLLEQKSILLTSKNEALGRVKATIQGLEKKKQGLDPAKQVEIQKVEKKYVADKTEVESALANANKERVELETSIERLTKGTSIAWYWRALGY